MIKKQPSMDSTWARPPTGQNSRPSTGSSTRQTLLPYRPTPSPRPTTYRPTPSNQLPTIVQRELNHDHLTHLPSHSKGTKLRYLYSSAHAIFAATFQWMRGELLGQGSYGRVYMALNASTGELMAVKQVELPREDHKPAHQDALRFLAFESKTLRELDHPNIVQYLGCESSAEALSVCVLSIYSLVHITDRVLAAFWSMYREERLRHCYTSMDASAKRSHNPSPGRFSRD